MAAILKFPGKTKGLVCFTKQETSNIPSFDFLRSKWVVGLHHNWQPAYHDNRFDVSIICKNYMMTAGAPVIDAHACSYVSKYFNPSPFSQRHWDILYVARSVDFKRISVFLNSIRKVYDMGYDYRVLLIACNGPMPTDTEKCPKDLLGDYMKMFSHEERTRFNLLEMNYNYPFTFDHETLAHFYKSSKVFTHVGNIGYWSRVASQAYAAGLSVVCYPGQSTVVPEKLRKSPVTHVYNNDSEIPLRMIEAVESYNENYDSDLFVESSNHFQPENTSIRTKDEIRKFFQKIGIEFDSSDGFNLHNLDRRIARHVGASIGDNKVSMSINDFMKVLMSDTQFDSESEDLEILISRG